MAEEQPEVAAQKVSAAHLVPQALIEEYAGLSEYLGKVLRGEIELKPLPEPRHRCFWCWLVATVSPRSHWRCRHGWLGSDCDTCRD